MIAELILHLFGVYFVHVSLALKGTHKQGTIPTEIMEQYFKDPLACGKTKTENSEVVVIHKGGIF